MVVAVITRAGGSKEEGIPLTDHRALSIEQLVLLRFIFKTPNGASKDGGPD